MTEKKHKEEKEKVTPETTKTDDRKRKKEDKEKIKTEAVKKSSAEAISSKEVKKEHRFVDTAKDSNNTATCATKFQNIIVTAKKSPPKAKVSKSDANSVQKRSTGIVAGINEVLDRCEEPAKVGLQRRNSIPKHKEQWVVSDRIKTPSPTPPALPQTSYVAKKSRPEETVSFAIPSEGFRTSSIPPPKQKPLFNRVNELFSHFFPEVQEDTKGKDEIKPTDLINSNSEKQLVVEVKNTVVQDILNELLEMVVNTSKKRKGNIDEPKVQDDIEFNSSNQNLNADTDAQDKNFMNKRKKRKSENLGLNGGYWDNIGVRGVIREKLEKQKSIEKEEMNMKTPERKARKIEPLKKNNKKDSSSDISDFKVAQSNNKKVPRKADDIMNSPKNKLGESDNVLFAKALLNDIISSMKLSEETIDVQHASTKRPAPYDSKPSKKCKIQIVKVIDSKTEYENILHLPKMDAPLLCPTSKESEYPDCKISEESESNKFHQADSLRNTSDMSKILIDSETSQKDDIDLNIEKVELNCINSGESKIEIKQEALSKKSQEDEEIRDMQPMIKICSKSDLEKKEEKSEISIHAESTDVIDKPDNHKSMFVEKKIIENDLDKSGEDTNASMETNITKAEKKNTSYKNFDIENMNETSVEKASGKIMTEDSSNHKEVNTKCRQDVPSQKIIPNKTIKQNKSSSNVSIETEKKNSSAGDDKDLKINGLKVNKEDDCKSKKIRIEDDNRDNEKTKSKNIDKSTEKKKCEHHQREASSRPRILASDAKTKTIIEKSNKKIDLDSKADLTKSSVKSKTTRTSNASITKPLVKPSKISKEKSTESKDIYEFEDEELLDKTKNSKATDGLEKEEKLKQNVLKNKSKDTVEKVEDAMLQDEFTNYENEDDGDIWSSINETLKDIKESTNSKIKPKVDNKKRTYIRKEDTKEDDSCRDSLLDDLNSSQASAIDSWSYDGDILKDEITGDNIDIWASTNEIMRSISESLSDSKPIKPSPSKSTLRDKKEPKCTLDIQSSRKSRQKRKDSDENLGNPDSGKENTDDNLEVMKSETKKVERVLSPVTKRRKIANRKYVNDDFEDSQSSSKQKETKGSKEAESDRQSKRSRSVSSSSDECHESEAKKTLTENSEKSVKQNKSSLYKTSTVRKTIQLIDPIPLDPDTLKDKTSKSRGSKSTVVRDSPSFERKKGMDSFSKVKTVDNKRSGKSSASAPRSIWSSKSSSK